MLTLDASHHGLVIAPRTTRYGAAKGETCKTASHVPTFAQS